ncbi:hypothetical protein [Dysgonomonas sp. 520]|uniref:hypothetical protein n=1 Tax=Dysgonomonas sp. 520 TaxID=2302931 RepID=UPI0013D86597|nr:hypothetical protein [Dysgonomonas sp. 520]NDW10698.1 hypothetical protein [Dysgonomonas sp. 520]
MGRIKKTQNKAEVQERIYQVSRDLINMENCEDIRRKYMAEWNCSNTNVNWYIKKAYDLIDKSTQKNIDRLINRQMATLEKIANSAITNNDRANSIKAVDTMNKLMNLYVEKSEVTVNTDAPIQISFGDLTVSTSEDNNE